MIAERKVPRYQQIRDVFVERIATGALPAGAMLPSEAEIGREFSVSSGTARKAMIELEQNGIVLRRQGRGTFVMVNTPERERYHFFRFEDEEGRRLIPMPGTETIERRRATAEEQKAFGRTCSVYDVRRVRSVNGVRSAIEQMLLPTDVFQHLMEQTPLPNALYAYYQSVFSVSVMEADDTLTATVASVEDAELLGVDEGTPLLAIHRVARNICGRVVELRNCRYLTTAMRYHVELR